ncbi:hypothetical protein DESC_180035 [Desulfosarcina cetonica]|nr:hypothetical protein DESC_180035 [Desulfosarcina cetonica]
MRVWQAGLSGCSGMDAGVGGPLQGAGRGMGTGPEKGQ